MAKWVPTSLEPTARRGEVLTRSQSGWMFKEYTKTMQYVYIQIAVDVFYDCVA